MVIDEILQTSIEAVPYSGLSVRARLPTPHMTLRYMKHAPEAYFAEDAARIAASLSGDAEGAASADLAGEGLRRA